MHTAAQLQWNMEYVFGSKLGRPRQCMQVKQQHYSVDIGQQGMLRCFFSTTNDILFVLLHREVCRLTQAPRCKRHLYLCTNCLWLYLVDHHVRFGIWTACCIYLSSWIQARHPKFAWMLWTCCIRQRIAGKNSVGARLVCCTPGCFRLNQIFLFNVLWHSWTRFVTRCIHHHQHHHQKSTACELVNWGLDFIFAISCNNQGCNLRNPWYLCAVVHVCRMVE